MFIILEFQTDDNGNTAVITPIQTRKEINDAKSVYHQILASAAISSVPHHTAVLMYHTGSLIATESFDHSQTEG